MKKFNIKYIHIPCESVSESVTDSEDFRSGFESFEYNFQHIESDLADLEPHSADDAEADSHMLQNFVPFPVTFDRSILIVRTAFDLDEFLTLQVLHVTSLSRGDYHENILDQNCCYFSRFLLRVGLVWQATIH